MLRDATPARLTLSDLIVRDVVIEWFEAVALMREVSARVRDGLAGQGVPELHQVELDAEGDVVLSGATETSAPVRRLGQMLQAALVSSEPPVQLRLIASQATAPSPPFGSISEFSEALAYFERPDRPAILRSLFERASAAGSAQRSITPMLDDVAPLTTASGSARRFLPSLAAARRAIGIVAVIALVAASLVWWRRSEITPTGTDMSALAVRASDAVGTSLVTGLSTVTEAVGLGRLAPAESSAPPAAAAVSTLPTQPPVRRASRQAPAASLQIFDLGPAPVAYGLPAAVERGVQPADADVSPLPIVPDPPIDLDVYTAADPGVSEPVGIRPQLPRTLPAGIQKEDLGRIELLVLPDGSVGTVKLLTHSGSVLPAMLLSAVKAWRFSPAMKDGQPVAFRKVVWIVVD